MTFNKMLKILVENPKAKFKSSSSAAREQNLNSIIFWIKYYAKKGRPKIIITTMIDAKDWTQEVNRE